MKKFLLSVLLSLVATVAINAKGIYKFALGDELTLAQAAASETGFVLVSDNQILGIAKDGDAGLTMYNINDVAVAYMVKLETISGVTGTSATEPNAYHVLFYKPNATKIEAGNRYGIWGNPNCSLTAVSWGSTWVAPSNADRPDGRDFDYSSRWNFEAQADGGFAVYFNEGEGRKYLNGGGISDNLQKVWHLHPLTKKLVANTTCDFTKISFEDAKVSTDPVVMVQNDMVLCNNNGGANYGTKSDFDEASYWVKFEEADAANNQYYITLNKDAETQVGYLNASVWSHVFISGVDKNGTKGEKQDGAIFIINSLGDNQYSVQNLGGSEGSYDYSGNAYMTFTTAGYWTGNATWQNNDPSVWEFYKLTNFKEIPTGDAEPEPEPWKCPEGEIDYTTLDGFKDVNNVGKSLNGGDVVYGDQSNGDRYTDVTAYEVVKFYGTPGATLRIFANREGGSGVEVGKTEQRITIGTDGIGTLYVNEVMEATGKEYCYLSGIKICATWQGASVDQNIVIDGITVIEKSAPVTYTIATAAGKIGTIALDYPASIEGATLYEVVSFDATTGLELAEVEGDMVGGTPYIYVADADEVVCTKKGASVAHGDFDCTKKEVGNGLVGCYSEVTPAKDWFDFIRGSYIISNNKLRQISNGNVTIPANRCFFDSDKCTSNNAASAKLVIAPEEATAINNVNAALEAGKIYDMNGREVKSMKKGGIYVVGGMKVSVK